MQISIIIPSFNREKLVQRAIKSLIKQSYKKFEIIIIDDASLDNMDSISLLDFTNFNLNANVKILNSTATNINSSSIHPKSEDAKEWTEGTGPPRFINIPKRDKQNAISMSTIFHIRNTPRRFCAIMECKNPVKVNHGINATFSMGSQAQ